jgi:hypothetical protein
MRIENQNGGSAAPLREGALCEDKVPIKIGVGIAGMRERVGQFRGQLALSREDNRTILQVTLPFYQSS